MFLALDGFFRMIFQTEPTTSKQNIDICLKSGEKVKSKSTKFVHNTNAPFNYANKDKHISCANVTLVERQIAFVHTFIHDTCCASKVQWLKVFKHWIRMITLTSQLKPIFLNVNLTCLRQP